MRRSALSVRVTRDFQSDAADRNSVHMLLGVHTCPGPPAPEVGHVVGEEHLSQSLAGRQHHDALAGALLL